MTKLTGVHRGLSRQEYDALTLVNFSTAKHIEKSPGHYRHALENPDFGDTDSRKRGRVVHQAVFEPDKLANVVVWEGDRRAGKAWDSFEASHQGKEILTHQMFADVSAISLAVRNSPQARPYLEDGDGEVTVVWDGPHGIGCRSRLDWVAGCGAIVDLKTTKDASPQGFGKEAANYLAHAQAAMYVDGYAAATGETLPYVLIAVEAVAPYSVQVYRVPQSAIELGRTKYRSWIDRIAQCRLDDNWPGYGTGELELTLPFWAYPVEQRTP